MKEMYWNHTKWNWVNDDVLIFMQVMGPIDNARLSEEPYMSLITGKYGSSAMHSPESHVVWQKLGCVMNSSA